MAKHDYFSEENLRKDLKKKAVRGGIVVGSSRIIGLLCSIVTIPILTRLLSPDDFGLIETVAVFTNFAVIFVDAGLSKATVQRDSITHNQVSNLFWVASGLGTIIAIAVACLSLPVSWAYNEPRLQPIMIAMSASYVFSGLTIQHKALLQRSMNYLALSVTDLISTLCGQFAAIFYAYQYRNTDSAYWALVLMPIVTSLTNMLLKWQQCSWFPSLPKHYSGTRDLLQFGANLTSFNFVNYFARNTDKILISWWWGLTAVGYYGRAYKLLMLPMTKLAPSVESIIVPTLSRLKNEPDKYRTVFLQMVRPYLWFTVPLTGWLFVVSEPLILVYFGPRWEAVTVYFQALIPAAWASSFVNCSGWVFTSWGHVHRHLQWGIIHSILMCLIIVCCVPFGVLTTCYGLGIGYIVLRIPGFMICFHGTPLRQSDIWYPVLIPSLFTGFSIIGTWYLTKLSQGVFISENPMNLLVCQTVIYSLFFLVPIIIYAGSIAELWAKIRQAS